MSFAYDPAERIRTLRLARAVSTKSNSDLLLIRNLNPTMVTEWDRDLRKWQMRLQRETALLAQASSRILSCDRHDDLLDAA